MDAVKQIVPFQVGGFGFEFYDKDGKAYLGDWNKGIYSTEDAAKSAVEYERQRECEQCFKHGVKGGYLVGCERGWCDCRKKAFKREFGEEWYKQAIDTKETVYDGNNSYEYNRCKRCYISKVAKGECCDGTSCMYIAQKQLFSEKWDKEIQVSLKKGE
ncbi:MAG: hypothetical protein K2H01_11035 [Ruminococcus sp.]|nr:hypothetical protein [Ruminococcus sp.]